MFDELFVSLRCGSGEIYGLSVSTRNKSFGTVLATSRDFRAVL